MKTHVNFCSLPPSVVPEVDVHDNFQTINEALASLRKLATPGNYYELSISVEHGKMTFMLDSVQDSFDYDVDRVTPEITFDTKTGNIEVVTTLDKKVKVTKVEMI